MNAAKRYMSFVKDSAEGPKNETLAEHREHCEAEEGNCPFEKEADKTDADVRSGAKRSTVTPDEDAEYMDVANRIAAARREGRDADAKDVETARRMVREAAAKAMPDTKVVDKDGLPMVVYHGTGEEFTKFREKEVRNSKFLMDIGIHFGRRELAEKYANPMYGDMKNRGGLGSGERGVGSRIVAAFINVQKPLDARQGSKLPDAFAISMQRIAGLSDRSKFWKLRHADPVDLVQKAIENRAIAVKSEFEHNGFDGAEYTISGMGGETAWMVFDPSQIKSADPVTYDDAGNVIPLSKRFNFASNDIRDEATGKVRKYLESVAEDASLAWTTGINPELPKKRVRRRPIDRIPKREVKTIISENCKLIKTIDEDMLPLVAGKVYAMLTNKIAPDQFIEWCVDECGIEEWQAERIARDQILKAQEGIKLADWKRRGINFVMWCHSGEDNEPREYHIRKWDGKSGIRNGNPNGLNGYVFRIDEPPVIDKKTGERGYCATLIGCKCFLKGVRGA